MVDAKYFMATERNGYNGQIFEALKNRFPEIPEQVISQTLQAEVGRFLIFLICWLFLLRILEKQGEVFVQSLLSFSDLFSFFRNFRGMCIGGVAL